MVCCFFFHFKSADVALFHAFLYARGVKPDLFHGKNILHLVRVVHVPFRALGLNESVNNTGGQPVQTHQSSLSVTVIFLHDQSTPFLICLLGLNIELPLT